MSKVRTGIQNSGTQLYVDQIRAELYEVWRQIRMLQNDHRAHFGSSHPDVCSVCSKHDSEVDGIRLAIIHFGGNPRTTGW